MATLAARAQRNAEARIRLDAVLDRIKRRLDIEAPEAPTSRPMDSDLIPIMEIERFAEFAERIDWALAGMAASDETPPGYEVMTVPMLREELKRRTVDIPTGSNKDDLIALLEDDDKKVDDPDATAAPSAAADDDDEDAANTEKAKAVRR
jgi:hypothetical protein